MTAYPGLGTYGNAVGVTTPLAHKLSNAAQVVKTTTPLVIRPGIFYAGNATIISGTAGMAYSVAAYEICTQRSASAGAVFGGNDGALSVATTAAPGSNSRIDIIYHWHREYSLDGVDSNPVIGVIQGTAAAVPTAPSLAAFPGAVEIGRATVGAGITATTSATFTQTAPFTTADGGKVTFRTTTEMNLWTTALTDQRAIDLSSGITYRWSGAAWKAWESDWITYAAAVSGFAVGTGGAAAAVTRYKYINGRILDDYKFVFGTSGATFPTSPKFSTAVAVPLKHDYQTFDGTGSLFDTSVPTNANDMIAAEASSTTQVRIYSNNLGGITTTAPWTWAPGDAMVGQFWRDPT